ncbi:MAG TPA: helix-turn-helix domain-containing protein [Burkholderiaceae bacterium]|nr:helix-turn-helix domain-containing protein [Burkholderiaceae bacterium]
MHIMVLNLDACESHLPAALSPKLVLFVRGGVSVVQADGTLVRRPRFLLSGPYMAPRRSISNPDTMSISVMFRPGLLQEGLGISSADINSRFLQMRDIADSSRVDQLLSDMDEERPIAEYVRLFQEFLLATLNLSHKKSIGAAFLAAHQKMFMPLIDIALYFGVGERQLERRVRQVFGVTLREVRHMSRFALTLQHLLKQPVAWGDLTHIAHESGYYDQAHMHREFVEMSGLPPIQLLQKIASDDPAYWAYRVTPADFQKLFIPVD